MIKLIKDFNILFVLGLFIIIYCPPIILSTSIHINPMHVVGILSILYLFINIGRFNHIVKRGYNMQILLFMIILFALLFVRLIHSDGFDRINFPLYFILDVIPFSLSLVIHCNKLKIGFYRCIELFIYIAVIQAILSLLAYCFNTVQDFFVDCMRKYMPYDAYLNLANHRLYGFASNLSFTMPIFQTVIGIISLYCGLLKNKWRYIIFSPLCILSGLINARSTIVICLLGIIALIIFGKMSFKKKIKLIIILCSCGVSIVLVGLPIIKIFNRTTYDWVMRGFEEVIAFIGGNSTGYFEYVTDPSRYKLPIGISFFIGEGNYVINENQFGFNSDIGFINDIWLGGILYLFIVYIFFFSCLYFMHKRKNKISSFVAILMFFTLLVSNIKGPVFQMNQITNFIIILTVLSTLISQKKYGNEVLSHAKRLDKCHSACI